MAATETDAPTAIEVPSIARNARPATKLKRLVAANPDVPVPELIDRLAALQKVSEAEARELREAHAPAPAAAEPARPRPPRGPVARPLYRDPDGRALQPGLVVMAVRSRYDAASGELDGLPRALELVGAWPARDGAAAAGVARAAGALGELDDAVVVNGRFASAVDAPREPGPAAEAGEGTP